MGKIKITVDYKELQIIKHALNYYITREKSLTKTADDYKEEYELMLSVQDIARSIVE